MVNKEEAKSPKNYSYDDGLHIQFIKKLYDEQIKHKEHRHEFVKLKLLFTTGLFSLGNLGSFQESSTILGWENLIYLVPS